MKLLQLVLKMHRNPAHGVAALRAANKLYLVSFPVNPHRLAPLVEEKLGHPTHLDQICDFVIRIPIRASPAVRGRRRPRNQRVKV